MLESILKARAKKLGKKLEVKSAGLYVVDEKVNPLARRALKERGLTTRHKPTQLSPLALERADTILTMTPQQKVQLFKDKCYYKVFSMREAVGFDITDPYGGGAEEYRACANLLEEAADIIINNLIKAGKI